MAHSADEHTGARIKRHRKERGLTQHGLALRAHVSHSLISKVECGQKPASPALVAACARALAVTPADLLGQPYADELRRDRMDALVQPIRVGMENWDIPHDWETPPRPVPLIREDIGRLLVQRRNADLMDMARDLPALIDECVHAVHVTSGEERRQAHECLAWAFRCVFTLAWGLGYHDLAIVALDRVAAAAPVADEPGLPAMHAYLRAQTVMASGRYEVGLRVVDQALRDLDGQNARRPGGLQAMTGVLLLRAAVLAGRAQDADHADARLDAARRLARETGELSDYGVAWGPVNVGVHAVAIASELDEYGQAIELAREVRLPQGYDRARAAHHWMDVGRAHTWAGNPTEALASLQRARRIAPQQTRYHPTTRESVIALKGVGRGRMSGELADFAAWVGA
ncbi:helix-turn-helix transcriptional regulator [Streptomyces sp. B1866]|uniref:helix-turn-helix domain-containing protein n=1 Tax=Streptomyces sp. B1866 TaxID=3075431 RepID=UPI00288F7414|nr:helix-turn-helix transcriptional regulator [Streptomyces sp. B1866]MDT3398347.1 helix-turn-helix transcriptional regulator [Streptomyces sp. B1866]